MGFIKDVGCSSNRKKIKLDGFAEIIESTFVNLTDSEILYLLNQVMHRSGFDTYYFTRRADDTYDSKLFCALDEDFYLDVVTYPSEQLPF